MMCYVIFGFLAVFQFHAIGSNTVLGISNRDNKLVEINQSKPIVQNNKKCGCNCGRNCGVSSKYIEIAQINRADLTNISIDELVSKLNATTAGNYKLIQNLLRDSECNFSYIRRGLRNLQQTIYDIIDILSCPVKRQDSDLLSAAIDIFVCAKDSMIGDMRDASKTLSQECADLFTKIRPAACNTGENVIFSVLNSI